MSNHSREYFIHMVERAYFANVDAKNLDAVLDCFTEDAVFTIQSSFTVHEGRETGIRRMFETFFANFAEGVHREFSHVVDVENDRCSCRFSVELTGDDGTKTSLSNCNFFYFENGKFKRVFVYMSGANVLV